MHLPPFHSLIFMPFAPETFNSPLISCHYVAFGLHWRLPEHIIPEIERHGFGGPKDDFEDVPNIFNSTVKEKSVMKRLIIPAGGILLVLTIAWVAFGQGRSQGGTQRYAQTREAQLKAITRIEESVAKLKSILEATPKLVDGRSFQDMPAEERTKTREALTKQREEQPNLISAVEQELMKLKSFRQLRTEQEESVALLRELLASAQRENAKETVAKVEQMIAQSEKHFEDKTKAMGFDPSQMPQQEQKPVGPPGKGNPQDAKTRVLKPTPAESDPPRATSSDAQPAHLKVTGAFTMNALDFVPLAAPRANPARPDEGFTFLVVGLGPINTKTKIQQTHLDGRLTDEKGNTYVPIAFGFPMQGSDKPLVMVGCLGGGDMTVVGSEDTFVGLIFVVPESSTGRFTLSTKDSEKQEIRVVSQFKAPDSSRIASLGLKEVDQPAKGDHWRAR